MAGGGQIAWMFLVGVGYASQPNRPKTIARKPHNTTKVPGVAKSARAAPGEVAPP